MAAARLGAVVPAAGLSSRMGRLKPALALGPSTVLECAVACLREAGVAEIVAVTGREAEAVAALARRAGARPVHNPDFERGMFCSVAAGVAALPDGLDGFFVLPADIPLVRPATVALVAEAFFAGPADWAVPTFRGERGHPPLLSPTLIPRILNHDGTGGLRAVLDGPGLAALEVPVADAAVLLDLDHPGDYERARELAARREVPEPEEVQALWDIAGTPPQTRAHCRAVGRAAAALARAVGGLDPALAEAAGLLHDVAKGERRHEEAGGRLLHRHGFAALAPLVAAHRDLDLAPDAPLTEREMVFLADKFVRGTTALPAERRYGEKIEQWSHDPEARRAIEGRLKRALAVRDRVRGAAGRDLLELVEEALS